MQDDWGFFTQVPDIFIEESSALTNQARWLFVLLRFHTNKKSKNAFPSYELLQQETGWTPKTISKAIHCLEKYGWLTREKGFGENTKYRLIRRDSPSQREEMEHFHSPSQREVQSVPAGSTVRPSGKSTYKERTYTELTQKEHEDLNYPKADNLRRDLARPTSQLSISDLAPRVAIEPQGEASIPTENTLFLSVRDCADTHAAQGGLFAPGLPVAENGRNASTLSGQIQPTPVSAQKRAISGSSVENFATQKMESNQCQVSDIFLKQVQSTTYASNVVQDLSLPKSKSENLEQANGVQSAMTRDVSLLSTPAKAAVKSLDGRELQGSIAQLNARRTTKKSNKNKVETDPRATHPAIVAFRDIVLKFPKKPVWDQIIAIVGDSPDRLKLEKCYVEAMMRGPWCSNGYKWVEWYRDGIPEYGVKPKKQKEVSKYGPVSFKEFAR